MGIRPRGEQLTVTNVPLFTLINMAYQLRPQRLVGAPEWTRTEHYDIQAKAPAGVPVINPQPPGSPFGPTSPQPFTLMLRQLLADRFGLRVHTERQEQPAYRLTKARFDGTLGPRLKHSTRDCAAELEKYRAPGATGIMPRPGDPPSCLFLIGSGALAHAAMPISALALMLEAPTQRFVMDETGLEGNFEFNLTWTPDELARYAGTGTTPPPVINGRVMDPNGPSLLTAVREQLGLKLEATTAGVEVLVVDAVSRPTPD